MQATDDSISLCRRDVTCLLGNKGKNTYTYLKYFIVIALQATMATQLCLGVIHTLPVLFRILLLVWLSKLSIVCIILITHLLYRPLD